MDKRAKRIVIIVSSIFIIGVIAMIIYALLPKLPSTQHSDKTVIIDNYSKYTEHISSDSFGTLGNYLYKFIKNPDKGVYHATITDGSYSYLSDSWFSKFVVKLSDSDTAWDISLQTVKNGDINGDISITCKTGQCLSITDGSLNAKTTLQSYLPLNSSDYIIAYQKDNHNALSIVYYDQAGTGKTKALEKIKSLGFDPDDYKIQYFYGGH